MNAFLYAVMIGLLALAFRYARRIRRARRETAYAAALRMLRYAEQDRPYVFYVGNVVSRLRFSQRSIAGTEVHPIGEWHRVEALTEKGVVTEAGLRVPIDEIESYLVTYPGGQVLDGHGIFEPLPQDAYILHGNMEGERRVLHFDAEDLQASEGLVDIAIEDITETGDREATYRITLTNRTAEPLALVRAALFDRSDAGSYEPIDIYEARIDAVLDWFGMEDAILEPGDSVTDPNGHGEPGEVWAFYFEFPDKAEIVAAKGLPAV